MVTKTSTSTIIRFHPFTLDLKNRELRKQGKLVKLQPQPFKVLALLASRAGEVVTRADIKQQIWRDDTFVDFDQGINFCIKQIRTALGDDAAEPRYLMTLPRRGYRFIAPMTRDGNGGFSAAGGPPQRSNRSRLAVLPFSCICSECQFDHVADGLTEELIFTLSKIRDFRLIARTSVMRYKSSSMSASDIGRELCVGTILEGSVRTDGKKLRVSTELIDTNTEETLWSQEYDRELKDLFAVQTDIARQIAEALKAEFVDKSESQIERSLAGNAEAYDLYLRGRYFSDKRTRGGLDKAVECFERAVGIDPNLARAYAGLAESLVLLVLLNYANPQKIMPKARAAAHRALELDKFHADAHTSLALILMFYDWDLTEAEKELHRAIDINPSHAGAHLWCAICMACLRRLEEETAQIGRALELSPLSLTINTAYGAALRDQGRYDCAMEHLKKTIEMEPSYPIAHAVLAGVYAETGMYEEWLGEYEKALTLRGEIELAETLARVYREAGYRGTMRKAASELAAQSAKKYVSAAEIAGFYAEAGETEQAIRWLGRAYEARDPNMIFIRSRVVSACLPWKTSWYHLRSDPNFESLIKKVGLEPRA